LEFGRTATVDPLLLRLAPEAVHPAIGIPRPLAPNGNGLVLGALLARSIAQLRRGARLRRDRFLARFGMCGSKRDHAEAHADQAKFRCVEPHVRPTRSEAGAEP